jgi:fimbrial chaperone protein
VRNSTRNCLIFAALIAGVAFIRATPASTAEFVVAPVQAFLSTNKRSELVNIINKGGSPVRFQLEAVSWQGGDEHVMHMQPTEDIAFFPQLFVLAPGEQRKIRVGMLVPPSTSEKSYRLFIRQLGDLEKVPVANGVRLITNMSLPIFIEPSIQETKGSVQAVRLTGGKLSFQLVNDGTMHMQVRSATVSGLDATGKVIFNYQQPGWYVLAGESRDFELPLEPAKCLDAEVLRIRIQTDKQTIETQTQVDAAQCTALSQIAEAPVSSLHSRK